MDKKKRDYLIYSLICQFVVCALLFGSFLGLRTINSSTYTSLKREYFDQLEENFLIAESESLQKADVANNDETSAEKTTKTDLNTEKTVEEKSSSEKKDADELSAEVSGTGGKDYSVKSKNDIPANVSVNTYTLNQKMVIPVNGRISSSFGVRTHPITGKLRFHAGVDIAAAMGTPIYSSFDGKVVVASYNKWNGNYVKVQHDNGIMTVYCHCKKIKVKKGDEVKAGEIIATVGSTGSSTGPHLHFEFRINNKSYDPEIAFKTAINAV